MDLVIPRFRAVYKPERQLAENETLIKFKGKIHLQFISIKPGRFGIKAFTLTEATTGYVLGSKVYTGKKANVVQKDLGWNDTPLFICNTPTRKLFKKALYTSFILLSIDNSKIKYLFTTCLLFPLLYSFYPKINVVN